MHLSLTLTRLFRVSVDVLFDFTNAAQNFVSFTGFGPIPGVRHATYETSGEPRLGSRRRIVKTDGNSHAEEIVAFERPLRHASRITGLTPPFSWLVREGLDDWRFSAEGTETRVTRTFTFQLTTPLAAIIAYPLLHLFMRAAVSRDLKNIERCHSVTQKSDR